MSVFTNSDIFNAVDGLILPTNHLFLTKIVDNPWLVIDLGQKYGIKTIKFINRVDVYAANTFIDVAVSASLRLALNFPPDGKFFDVFIVIDKTSNQVNMCKSA